MCTLHAVQDTGNYYIGGGGWVAEHYCRRKVVVDAATLKECAAAVGDCAYVGHVFQTAGMTLSSLGTRAI